MAMYVEEDELQGEDPHAGPERSGGEGHAQSPTARGVHAGRGRSRSRRRRQASSACSQERRHTYARPCRQP